MKAADFLKGVFSRGHHTKKEFKVTEKKQETAEELVSRRPLRSFNQKGAFGRKGSRPRKHSHLGRRIRNFQYTANLEQRIAYLKRKKAAAGATA